MIKVTFIDAAVKTELIQPVESLRGWCTDAAVESQKTMRRVGEGVIKNLVPGSGGDLLEVLHADNTIGLYFYSELTYVETPDILRKLIKHSAGQIEQQRKLLSKMEAEHDELTQKLSKAVLGSEAQS